MVTRRGFLQLFAGAIATAGAGITLAQSDMRPTAGQIAEQTKLGLPKRVCNARHLYEYDIASDGFWHRIDVLFDDNQFCVDMLTQKEKLDAHRELEPALALLERALEKYDVEVGEIFTFSRAEWCENKDAQDRWGKIGSRNNGRLN